MSSYQVRASNRMGVIQGHTAYPVEEALRLALDFRKKGFSKIYLIDVVSGVEAELDKFLR